MLPFDEKGVTNEFVGELVNRVCKPGYFGGVYAADEFKESFLASEKRKGWIINLNPRMKKENGHFICVLQEHGDLVYIDPVGLPCVTEPLRSVLTKTGKNIYFNTTQVQDLTSICCGFFSALFLIYFSKKNRIFKMKFDSVDLKKNDQLCFSYLKKLVELEKTEISHILENVM